MNGIFNFDTQLLLQAFGIIFTGIGVAARIGLWKKWYWRSKTSIYSYIPLGVIFILYSFSDQAREQLGANYWIFQASLIIPVAIGVWWVARPPAFVKPDWVRWVEAYPEPIYQAMQQAAQNDPSWERHVASQEAVQEWARSLEKAKPPNKTKSKARS